MTETALQLLAMSIGMFFLPIFFAWAEGEGAKARAFGWSVLSGSLYGLLVFSLYRLIAPQAAKYAAAALYIGVILMTFTFSFLRMRRSLHRASAWAFRATLVMLVLFSVWTKHALFYGDEPWYLMQTASLADDGDVYFGDEFRRGAYHEFLHLTMPDDQFLAGWRVKKDSPPSLAVHFYGTSLIMAPFYRIARDLEFPPYLLRIFIGLPFLLFSAAAIGRVAGWVSAETSDPRVGLWVVFLFIGATPIHIWSNTLSPMPVLFALLTFAAVELVHRDCETLRWNVLAAILFPWIHPIALYMTLLFVIGIFFIRPLTETLRVAGIAAASLVIKFFADYQMQTGFFSRYADAVVGDTKPVMNSIPNFLSHWIGADAGFLFYAPPLLVILFCLPMLLKFRRLIGIFLLINLAFMGAFATSNYVYGMGRLVFWWIPLGLAFALSVGEVTRKAALVGLAIGWISNLFFTIFVVIQKYLPSASIRSHTGFDPAYFAPQFGRRDALLLSRSESIEWLLAAVWCCVIVMIYRQCWIVRPKRGS